MEYQKKKSPMLLIAFIACMVVFVLLRILNIALGLSRYYDVRYALVDLLVTIVASVPAVLAVVFCGLRIKPAAIALAAINLLVRLYSFITGVIDFFRYVRYFGLFNGLLAYGYNIVFVAAAVLILLCAVDVIKNRKIVAFGLLAVGAVYVLCGLGSYIILNAEYIAWYIKYRGFLQFLPNFVLSSLSWFSTLSLYGGLAAGLLCFTPKNKQPMPYPYPNQYPNQYPTQYPDPYQNQYPSQNADQSPYQ